MTGRAGRPSGSGTEVSISERFGGRDRYHRIQFFTISETAEMLRVATRTVRRRNAAGELVAHRFGGVVCGADHYFHAQKPAVPAARPQQTLARLGRTRRIQPPVQLQPRIARDNCLTCAAGGNVDEAYGLSRI
jgi:hypothetical protein